MKHVRPVVSNTATRILGLSVVLTAALAVTACGGDDNPGTPDTGQGAGTPAPTAASCSALASATGFPNATTRITSATFTPATATVAEHCLVNGSINERTGVDGQSYAIKFRVRLPTTWSGRLYMGGGGGINGTVVDPVNATAQDGKTLLSLGYVTLGTDSGHDNAVNTVAAAGGTAAFGLDPQARIDFGFNSLDETARVGKALVSKYFGKGPDKSYFMGCSEGGREAMILSQRFPTYFDGIVAGDPGYHLPLASVDGINVSQTFAALARSQNLFDTTGAPAINKTFTDPDLMLVRNGVLAACDGLDGLKDGIVDNMPACTNAVVKPEMDKLQCTGAKTDSCLLPAQLTALNKALAGARNAQGQVLYNTWPWDAGISGQSGTTYNQGWRSWWLGSYASAVNNSTKLVFAVSNPLLFTTPPVAVPTTGVVNYALNYSFDVDAPKVYARSGIFSQSAAQYMFAESTALSPFSERGGKLILYHGGSDTSFSVQDTIDYYNALGASNQNVSNFARLFVVPGMNHCSGGPATDSFDALTPLVNWVEKGTAPDSIVAAASNPGYFNAASRTRPLCPYPKQTRYKGTGDVNDAANFMCQ